MLAIAGAARATSSPDAGSSTADSRRDSRHPGRPRAPRPQPTPTGRARSTPRSRPSTAATSTAPVPPSPASTRSSPSGGGTSPSRTRARSTRRPPSPSFAVSKSEPLLRVRRRSPVRRLLLDRVAMPASSWGSHRRDAPLQRADTDLTPTHRRRLDPPRSPRRRRRRASARATSPARSPPTRRACGIRRDLAARDPGNAAGTATSRSAWTGRRRARRPGRPRRRARRLRREPEDPPATSPPATRATPAGPATSRSA